MKYRQSLCAALWIFSLNVLAQDAGAPASPDRSRAADNSAVNTRDRNTTELTADQQHQNFNDLRISQSIRQALMNDNTLSTYAQNVKIITQDGRVTLKGPVKSEAEKRSVETKAKAVAGDAFVSALEVAH